MERKKAQITIKSTQHDIENTEEKQTYSGHYAYKDGIHFLSYEEIYGTGAEKAVIKNLYKISDHTLYLSKSGAIMTKMLFDPEKKYHDIYQTPLGSFRLFLNTKTVEISTSGKSPNLVNALAACQEKGITSVAIVGANPCPMDQYDFVIHVPSRVTPRIQECQTLIGHILCFIVENQLFGKD